MAEGAQQTPAPATQPISIRNPAMAAPAGMPSRPGMKLDTPVNHRFSSIQAHSASMGVMSPVNQNGCFEFDRIIKAGSVLKRTRKTRQWKPIYIVLRPNCLSIYKDKAETKLRHQINLSEITAVARQKDSKRKMDHVFGIFSPARNYHLGATTDREAQEWVDLIRAEARIDEEEGELVLLSPTGTKTFTGFDRGKQERLNVASSSSEAEPQARPSSSLPREALSMHSARRPSQALNYSGNERGSVSDFDFSDSNVHGSTTSLPSKTIQQKRNISQTSNLGIQPDDDRVVYHGWLYVLKSKGGVRQWKKVWVVLRPKCLAFYKNGQEYSAHLIIPFSSIIDAVDIDSVSKSKQFCMQVISEEKNFRFCAKDENSLAKWLGAFKSLLIKRKEVEQKQAKAPLTIVAGTAANTAVSQQKKASIAVPNIPVPATQPLAIK